MVISDNEKTKSMVKLNDPEDLKNIVIALYGINASVPKKSKSILELSYLHSDPAMIKKTLQTVVNHVMKRHKKKM